MWCILNAEADGFWGSSRHVSNQSSTSCMPGTVLSSLRLIVSSKLPVAQAKIKKKKNVQSPQPHSSYQIPHLVCQKILSALPSSCTQGMPAFHPLQCYSSSSLPQMMAITSSVASLLLPFLTPVCPRHSSQSDPLHTQAAPCHHPAQNPTRASHFTQSQSLSLDRAKRPTWSTKAPSWWFLSSSQSLHLLFLTLQDSFLRISTDFPSPPNLGSNPT